MAPKRASKADEATVKKVKKMVDRKVKPKWFENSANIQLDKAVDTSTNARKTSINSAVLHGEGVLNAPPLGTATNQRIGDVIDGRHLHIRGLITMNFANVTPTAAVMEREHHIRIILLEDRIPEAAAPTGSNVATDLLGSYSTTAGGYVTNIPRWQTRDRYRILSDRTHALDMNQTSVTSGSAICNSVQKYFTIDVPSSQLGQYKARNSAAAAGLYTQQWKPIYLLAINAGNSQTPNDVHVRFVSRFEYKDFQ